MPAARYPFLDHPGPIPFAHRGGAKDHPENTMVAFEAAVALGYRYLETDVQATRDGVLVVFHDDTLDRVTDRTGVIAELPYAEVRLARVQGEPIPLLEDVLGTWPDLLVNVDAKNDHGVEHLIAAVQRTNSVERVCIGSFHDSALARIRTALGPRLCTSAGPREVARVRAASLLPGFAQAAAGRSKAACLQVPVRYGRVPIVDGRLVRAAGRIGAPVQVWTVDDAAEIDRLLDLGVLGIMTDRLQVLKDVLVRRGQWYE
jgi:glycerophosphoryl diester phosphodiesterase